MWYGVLIVLGLAVLSLVLVVKRWQQRIDSWHGFIEKKSIKHYERGMEDEPFYYLLVQTDDGLIKHVRVSEEEYMTYHEGDRVAQLPGRYTLSRS